MPESVRVQIEKGRARLQEGEVDGDRPRRRDRGARHIEQRPPGLNRHLGAHDEAAKGIERGGRAYEVEERARRRDLMHSARDRDEGRGRARLNDAASSRAEDEIVRGLERSVDGLQKSTSYLEGAVAGGHESLGSRREKEAAAVDVSERTARGVRDDSRVRRLEQSASGQEPDREAGIREVEQRGGAGARKAGPCHLEEMVEGSDRAAHGPREAAAQRELAIGADLAQIRPDHRGVTEVESRAARSHGKRSRFHAHQLTQSRHDAALGLEKRAAKRRRGRRRDVEAIGARAQEKQAIGEADQRRRAGPRERASRSEIHQRGAAHHDRTVHRVEQRAGQGERSLLEARQGLRDHDAAVEADEGARGAAGEAARHLEHVAPESERAVRGPEEVGREAGHDRWGGLIEIARDIRGLVRIGEKRRRSAGVAATARHGRRDRRLAGLVRGVGRRFARVCGLVAASGDDARQRGRPRELARGQRRHDARVLRRILMQVAQKLAPRSFAERHGKTDALPSHG